LVVADQPPDIRHRDRRLAGQQLGGRPQPPLAQVLPERRRSELGVGALDLPW
jgi:hypothetical protein